VLPGAHDVTIGHIVLELTFFEGQSQEHEGPPASVNQRSEV